MDIYIPYLVKIDNTIANVFIKRTLQRRTTTRNGSVMTGTNVQLIVILYNKIKKVNFEGFIRRFLMKISRPTFKRRGQLEVSIAGAEAVGLITVLSAIVVY
jgi:hypothetical protein